MEPERTNNDTSKLKLSQIKQVAIKQIKHIINGIKDPNYLKAYREEMRAREISNGTITEEAPSNEENLPWYLRKKRPHALGMFTMFSPYEQTKYIENGGTFNK